jgi:SAM-dependent methyltransferase
MEHALPIAQRAEQVAAAGGSLEDVLAALRRLSLDDFGRVLFGMPTSEFPTLSRILPAMAPAQVQVDWTGVSGLELLKQSTTFIRQLENNCARHLSRALQGQTILDFGCGYGRLYRLLYYFSNPDRLWGLDAWQRSLDHCIKAGLPGNFVLSEAVPTELPVGELRFDVAFAFSIFTHLSPAAAEASLAAIRRSMNSGGVFIATIRNAEYWPYADSVRSTNHSNHILQEISAGRFGYIPHNGIEGSNYGDAAVPMSFFDREDWRVLGYDSSFGDPFQISVVLQAS